MIKIFSILMMSIIGISMFGLYPALKLVQLHAAEIMEDSLKQNLPDEQLTVFQNLQDNKNVSWENEDKEFHYKGEMYDVVRIEKKKGNLLYYCMDDKKEAEVCALIDNLINGAQDKNPLVHTGVQKILKLFIQVFTPSERYCHAICPVLYQHAYAYNYYTSHYSGCYVKITAPPPKMV